MELNLDEGDLIDFLERGDATPRLFERRLAEECHALFARRAANFGGGRPVENQSANALGKIQLFVDDAAAAESSAAAFKAPDALVKGHVAPLGQRQAALRQVFIGILYGRLAMRADPAHQPLRE